MNRGIKASQPGGGIDSEVVVGIEGGDPISPNHVELPALDEFWTRPRLSRPKLRGVFWAGLGGRRSADR